MRWFTGFCAALGLVTVAAVAPAASAQAASASQGGGVSIAAYSDCPPGWFCVWEHVNEQGRMARFQVGSTELRAVGINDQISSVYNRTNRTWCAYTDINYNGQVWRVPPGWRGNVPSDINDRISSVRPC
ncbi:hypothetical protein DMH01_15380 [Amycolatopsis sp. WAC 04182]|uniref:peptidase inhibitor family I36 protein n=1 Tax=Amycolatopsis sp. WAC 04182 TaxID=2203198 RepID=UPI000F7B1D1F|nr:peptidase inhibitor family I36 protein [Amycolatopsis sp. WAC 04182]RSN60669.1 hypothetical protein DMH01_15380 [Amycolatopsis sp. WAC 04182]